MLPAECAYGTCDYEVVWSLSEDETKLNIKIAAATTGWVAVGFSDDQKMGDDHVLMCMQTGKASAKFEHRYNKGRENIIAEETNYGITVKEINYSDGKVSCRLERNVSVITGGKVFDVYETDYYMFFARGPMVNGVPHQHDVIPPVTSTKVYFDKIVIVDTVSPTAGDGDGDGNSAAVKRGGHMLVMFSMLMGLIASNLQ